MRGARPRCDSAWATAPRATATSGLSLCSRRSGAPRQSPSVCASRRASAPARNTPPLSSSASGNSGPCWRRKAAMWRVMAASRAYGRPKATMPPRACTGCASSPTCGKKPSTIRRSTSSRCSITVRLPPISWAPPPSSVTGACSGASWASSTSLAARHRSISCASRGADSGAPGEPPMRASMACASARSMLSPPSIRWLPTPTRLRRGWPSAVSSSTSIRLRSVVPPPTSQTSTRRVCASSSASRPWWRSSQSWNAACGSSSRRSCGRPASRAASRVRARAPSSKDAGTVSRISCRSSGLLGNRAFQAERTWRR